MIHDFLSNYSPWLDTLIWSLNIPLQLRLRENEKDEYVEKSQKVNEMVILTYMILIWTILYAIYNKCLSTYLRSLDYAFIRRYRLSNATWSCGLSIIITLYTIFLWDVILKPELSVIILKSFYIHYSMNLILINKEWLNGFSNILLILFMFGISRTSLKPPVTNIFLLSMIDVIMLDICKIVYLMWPHKVHHVYSKILYIIYCILWTYLYVVHVPINLLLPYRYQSLHEKSILWLWCLTHYYNFVWSDFIKYYSSSKLLPSCLFPNPSSESIRLSKLFNAHKKVKHSKEKDNVAAKKELWQTLICAMKMKRKLHRLKKYKHEKKDMLEQENPNSESK